MFKRVVNFYVEARGKSLKAATRRFRITYGSTKLSPKVQELALIALMGEEMPAASSKTEEVMQIDAMKVAKTIRKEIAQVAPWSENDIVVVSVACDMKFPVTCEMRVVA